MSELGKQMYDLGPLKKAHACNKGAEPSHIRTLRYMMNNHQQMLIF